MCYIASRYAIKNDDTPTENFVHFLMDLLSLFLKNPQLYNAKTRKFRRFLELQ